jgi:methylthioxylose transferase
VGRAPLAIWLAVVLLGVVWGSAVVADSGVALRAAPLYGRWSWHPGWGLAPAVMLASVVVVWGPMAASRMPWRRLPWFTGAAAIAWTAALAASDGWSQLTAPLTTRHEYEPWAEGVGDLGGFLSGFTDRLATYPVHVQGHPPGPVVAAWALDRLGLEGAGWLAAVVVAAWGVAVAAALVAVRDLAGEPAARRAGPALVVLPAAVWAGTSVDGLFAALTAVGLALAVRGAARSSAGHVASAGAVLGVALLFTYGAVAFVAIAAGVVVAVGARPRPQLMWLAAGVLVPLALAGVAGFWWPDGLAATGDAYWRGIGGERPGLYATLAGNPAALALATGPAVAAGLVSVFRVPDRRAWVLPGAAVVALVVADLSQLTRGEVERIWLPFVPWLALVAPGDRRRWLAGQAGVALLLQAAIVSAW